MVAEVLRRFAEVCGSRSKSSMKSTNGHLRRFAEVCGSRSKSSMKSMRRFAEVCGSSFAEVGPLLTLVKKGGLRGGALRPLGAGLRRSACPVGLRPNAFVPQSRMGG